MNILIIRTSAIGDVFLSGQFAQYVKSVYPDAQVDWLVEKRCSSVLKNNPYIDRLILWERKKENGIKGLITSANSLGFNKKYDLVIDLQCLLKLFFIHLKIKAKKRIGTTEREFPMNIFYNKMIETKRFEPLKDKYYRMAQEILGYKGEILDPPITYSKEDKEKAAEYFSKNNLDNAIGIVFATSKEHKYWDKDKWAALADAVKERYGAKCILFGAPSDKTYADYLMSRSDNLISIVGETSITESMAYLSECKACVSTDTALMHFSSILNIPTISLYGTNFFYSHHIGRANTEIIFKGDMNNRDQKVPDTECKKNMQNIEIKDITDALDKYLISKS